MSTRPREYIGETAENIPYRVICCGGSLVHLVFEDKSEPRRSHALTPEEAYQCAQALLRGYDFYAGI